MKRVTGFVRLLLFSACSLAFCMFCTRARAEPTVEISEATGIGAFVVGITPPRLAISPSVSVSVRGGEHGFFVARDTVSFLGATGGRFGIDNETTAGLSFVGYSLPLCGSRLCGRVHGIAPGASVRTDVFGPYLSGALGVSLDCGGAWITGSAHAVWSGVSVRCSAGPILRLTSRH